MKPIKPRRPVGEHVTAADINALPDKIRRYIHDLETRCDPAGDVQRMRALEDENAALRAKLEPKSRPLGPGGKPFKTKAEMEKMSTRQLERYLDSLGSITKRARVQGGNGAQK